ncbi:hypothetical protein [Nonomuraea typhae]|uniref:hypothetical protein n=1 Tax=Nonomuraea typhae TaxID=2603600 RepID=UPI0012F85E0C|nr:hypothetical protein [Nonomuraea typhae]
MISSFDDPRKARGELAQHAFETAGRIELLAEHMEIVGWRIDGYSTSQLKELANLLRGTAIRAALASDDEKIVSMVMGKPIKKLDPDILLDRPDDEGS